VSRGWVTRAGAGAVKGKAEPPLGDRTPGGGSVLAPPAEQPVASRALRCSNQALSGRRRPEILEGAPETNVSEIVALQGLRPLVERVGAPFRSCWGTGTP
jgi:hypothetical protein